MLPPQERLDLLHSAELVHQGFSTSKIAHPQRRQLHQLAMADNPNMGNNLSMDNSHRVMDNLSMDNNPSMVNSHRDIPSLNTDNNHKVTDNPKDIPCLSMDSLNMVNLWDTHKANLCMASLKDINNLKVLDSQFTDNHRWECQCKEVFSPRIKVSNSSRCRVKVKCSPLGVSRLYRDIALN